MKYGSWQIAPYHAAASAALEAGGFSPLCASVLCSRGYLTPEAAHAFLDQDAPLVAPQAMRDLETIAQRLQQALSLHEKIVVYGDYDVDGITATSLLTDFLRWKGGNCMPYIPSRLEEGYGLNAPAIRALAAQGAQLIVTVDCGITALEEAALCRSLGIDLCITDHHECKDTLPQCVAVADPHRRDDTYPHKELSGVGVAFKLACAMDGDQQAMLARYSDLLCLGTIADVMQLTGENRTFVRHGLRALQSPKRPGLRALIEACGCQKQPITAGTVGYVLSPRINAAGRMGQVQLALDLFLTEDAQQAAELAQQLCQLNRQRQDVEHAIYESAVSKLPARQKPDVIVLSDPSWHQGVVGIVASRLAEEYRCPAILICPDGNYGKASSRSYGGFNLFAALETLSPLLESYGGHELAAGFTIRCDKIDAFRAQLSQLCRQFFAAGAAQSVLRIDCAVHPSMLTLQQVATLDALEPCGAGCPRPVFFLGNLLAEQVSEVGGGKHLRLRLRRDGCTFSAIFFSTTALQTQVSEGDCIEIAFTPQINEFRGVRSVQLSLVDLRQAEPERRRCEDARARYLRYHEGTLLPGEAAQLLPGRQEFVVLWRYLWQQNKDGQCCDTAACLARKLSRACKLQFAPERVRICLDVFCELGLIQMEERQSVLRLTRSKTAGKVQLEGSRILQALQSKKAGES